MKNSKKMPGTYGLHVQKLPNEKFTFVGSVPLSLMEAYPPTQSDIMGGRVVDGKAWKTQKFDSINELLTAVKIAGAQLCTIPSCVCRKYF